VVVNLDLEILGDDLRLLLGLGVFVFVFNYTDAVDVH
jgi:hypothetical protein